MALVVGIDEAGYGPLLGPLVVGASLWEAPPQLLNADYWRVLERAVARDPRHPSRLPINDSKQLYGTRRELSVLERPVLAFARAAGLECASLAALLARLGVEPRVGSTLPWYADLGRLRLPTDPVHSGFEAAAELLRRCMLESGLRCRGLLAEVVPEDRFNQRIGATRNKAAVLAEHVLRLIARAAREAGTLDLLVRADRLGGRQDYRRLLLTAFPQRELTILEVTSARSRYRLSAAGSQWLIEFIVDADQRHLPVALASMLAKYLRELLMQRFNAYWRQHLPALRPTAGYARDARRFLAELGAGVTASGLSTERFVRQR